MSYMVAPVLSCRVCGAYPLETYADKLEPISHQKAKKSLDVPVTLSYACGDMNTEYIKQLTAQASKWGAKVVLDHVSPLRTYLSIDAPAGTVWAAMPTNSELTLELWNNEGAAPALREANATTISSTLESVARGTMPASE